MAVLEERPSICDNWGMNREHILAALRSYETELPDRGVRRAALFSVAHLMGRDCAM
jgi:hypothetical protein